MNYNYGYKKRVFTQEQDMLRKQYEAAGMSEKAILEMYEFDLEYFRLLRREAIHAVEPQEMMSNDSETGDLHYMDMDELPAQDATYHVPDRYAWIEEIETHEIKMSVQSCKPEYIEIITLLMEGYRQREIAELRGVPESTISDKLMRIRKKFRKFS